AGTWSVGGGHDPTRCGRGTQAYEPFMYSGIGSSYSGQRPAGLHGVAYTYDASGNVLTTSDVDGIASKLTSRRVYHPLSVDILDAEQLPGGKHVGASTTLVRG